MLVERLSQQTGKSVPDLLSFASSASLRYKVFEIDKRSGGKRKIEQPSKAVKSLQRWLVHTLFSKYNIHPSAIGYRKNMSILDNALPHASFRYTVRLDFNDFFWSFRKENIESFLRKNSIEGMSLSENDILFASNVVSRNGRLAMGAPSSPTITNAMMYNFDRIIARIASEHQWIYTRYADDLFISTNFSGQYSTIVKNVSNALPFDEVPELSLNLKKNAFLSKKHHRSVTGLVITPDGGVSLGRDRKRKIKALIHQFTTNKIDEENLSLLSGLLNWSASVEPNFIISLHNKYGRATVDYLRKAKVYLTYEKQ